MHERLERTATAAEQDNQRLAVASLSAQQLRAAEVRAKIGGVGGYAPQRTPGPGEGATFAINFHFSSGHTERIAVSTAALMIDAEPEPDEVDALPGPGAPSPELARLAAAFGATRSR